MTLPETAVKGPFTLRVKVTDTERGDTSVTGKMEFLTPDPRLTNNETLNAKDFVQYAVWVSFIVFAVKNQPPQVERIARGTVVSQAQPKQP